MNNIIFETTPEAAAIENSSPLNVATARALAPIVLDNKVQELILVKGGVLPTLAIAFNIPLSTLRLAVVSEEMNRIRRFSDKPYQFPFEA